MLTSISHHPDISESKPKQKQRGIVLWLTFVYSLALLLLWLVESYLAERHWTTLGLTYMPQQLTLIPAAVFLWWSLRLRETDGVVHNALLLPICCVVFLGFNIPLGRVSKSSGRPLRLMTYNIEHGRKDINGIIALIEERRPDVVCLQEANGYGGVPDPTEPIRRRLPGWHFARTADVATLSRYPIAGSRPHPALQWSTRGNLETTIDLEGSKLTLFNVHLATVTLGTSNPHFKRPLPEHLTRIRDARNGQLEVLQQAIAASYNSAPRQPIVIAGDFNTPPRGLVYKSLARDFNDAFRRTRWGWGHTFRSDIPVLRIDYIWTGPGIEVHDCDTPAQRYSDHRPLVADIALVDAASTPVPIATPSSTGATPAAPTATPLAATGTPQPTLTVASPTATIPPRVDASQSATALSNLPLKLPGPAWRPLINDPRVAQLNAKNKRFPTYAAYRELADIYLRHGLYDEVARHHRTQAAMYRRAGLINAAIIEEERAKRYDTTLRLYLEREANRSELASLDTRAPLEPPVGCYLGAFIDRDEKLKQTYFDENWQTHRTPREFHQHSGKSHASYFMYISYRQKFPRTWIEACKQAKAIPHLAWEPKNLNEVEDDEYLRSFARACRDAEWPIFIRFASEMNGDWTPYHGNPALYRQKFKLLHRVLHSYASNVATIWCVNNPPLHNVAQYYPGDDGCDWVGVNVYSVPYHENKRHRPAFQETPLALLDPIYAMYAKKKPIAICEFAASHKPALDHKLYNDFAVEKMSLMYGALPRLYPRVKLINWFDMNSIRHPVPGKTLSDFTVTTEKPIIETYRRLIVGPYFLGESVSPGGAPPALPRAVVPGQQIRGVARFSVWSSLAVADPKVFFRLDNKVIYASNRPGAHEVNLELATVTKGKHTVSALVYDAQNRFVNSATTTVTVVK